MPSIKVSSLKRTQNTGEGQERGDQSAVAGQEGRWVHNNRSRLGNDSLLAGVRPSSTANCHELATVPRRVASRLWSI
jgi:hypothetical protein